MRLGPGAEGRMGCGGSRADAIEPRYYESWTRETESTWLTSTDTETPAGGPQEDGSTPEASPRDKKQGPLCPGILEDGKTPQNAVTVSTTAPGILNPEILKKTNSGTQCGKPSVFSTGTKTPKQKGIFRTAEAKRESKRIAKKEVTINVQKSIRKIDSDGRITENCAKEH
ncbi:brain and acute leukemia cytoplasmic protein [Ambystoma mexicanum]|uniref:brain and acute leukemia cytoplasmic protein n=1 Tax=Ambystoma mexicanum TaxID=8296 RepID=UPI0037E7D1E4